MEEDMGHISLYNFIFNVYLSHDKTVTGSFVKIKYKSLDLSLMMDLLLVDFAILLLYLQNTCLSCGRGYFFLIPV